MCLLFFTCCLACRVRGLASMSGGWSFPAPFSLPSLSTPGTPLGFYLWLCSYPFSPLELFFDCGLAFLPVSFSLRGFDLLGHGACGFGLGLGVLWAGFGCACGLVPSFLPLFFKTLPVIALVDVLTCLMLAHLVDGCLLVLGFWVRCC